MSRNQEQLFTIVVVLSPDTCALTFYKVLESRTEESATACAECPVGTFAQNRRSAFCTDCAVGSFAPLNGSTSCDDCPRGVAYANMLQA
eukprot:5833523-Amphidinium_carterae.1